jgi:hypothetical protein
MGLSESRTFLGVTSFSGLAPAPARRAAAWQLARAVGQSIKASFFVRPEHRFSVPTWHWDGRRVAAAVKADPTNGRGTAKGGLALTAASTAPDWASLGRMSIVVARPPACRGDRRRARHRAGEASAATLYSVIRFGIDHDAVIRIGGRAPKGGPILQQRHEGHGRVRDTATSDRDRQILRITRAVRQKRYFQGWVVLLTSPGAAEGPPAPRRW